MMTPVQLWECDAGARSHAMLKLVEAASDESVDESTRAACAVVAERMRDELDVELAALDFARTMIANAWPRVSLKR